mgnify:FL=1
MFGEFNQNKELLSNINKLELLKKLNKDKCVNCDTVTTYNMDTNIMERNYYVEGAGQLCEKCYNKIYK